jgi:nitrogen fixation/metabolism regulation signal transduction histidine kinase
MAKQVAHEIKNPLTPMRLSVQHLKKAWDEKSPGWEERLDRFTSTIIEQIDSLSDIASEFSDFAKMPVGSMEKIDLATIIRASSNLFKDSGNIHIELDLPVSACNILADNKQMLRVFNNLIKNSIQAIGKDHHGLIRIRLREEGDYFLADVTDNGPGIPASQADKIFTPSFTTKSSGMGLGLAMVKSILTGISGTISFTSEEGKGTTFSMKIPGISDK